uniref:RNA replication protein n=1 Tax=Phyllanthus potexvirus 1 TaxID=2794412 RepID=A0A7T5UFS6_9VIRU|nr:RdRp [Phyllanthus potexvirus 1]
MSAIQAVFERLSDPQVRSTIQEEAYRDARSILDSAKRVNPYAVDSDTAQALEGLGIATNPFSVSLHTHAGAKAIENRLLEIVGSHLPKDPVTFMYLKRAKLSQLRRDPRIKDAFLNQHLEPRDIARYEPKTVVQSLPLIETGVVYISDALHFVDFDYLAQLYLSNPAIQTVYATMVLPPEAAHRHPSQHPHLYTINYCHDGFQYIPGRHGGGAYHHEYSSLKWLKVGHINYYRWCGGTPGAPGTKLTESWITCQLLESLGANHLFMFQRGKLKTPRVRTFYPNTLVTLPKVFYPAKKNAVRPITKTMAMQLFLYVKSLKVVTSRDVYAKIRQLIKTQNLPEYSPAEIVHLANYMCFIAGLDSCNSYEDVLGLNILRKTLLPIKAKIKELWATIAGADAFDQLLAYLEWEDFSYSVEVTKIQATPSIHHQPLVDERDRDYSDSESSDDDSEDEPADDDVESLDSEATVDAKDPQSSGTQASTSKPQPHTVPKKDIQLLPWRHWFHILKDVGFRADQKQFDQADDLIMPVTRINTLPKEKFEYAREIPKSLRKILDKANRSPVVCDLSQQRASYYGSDVKNMRIGAFLKKSDREWLKTFGFKCETIKVTVPVSVIHGAGGSGKSHMLQTWMRTLHRRCTNVTVVLPTNELRIDWENKVPQISRYSFKTYERALTQAPGHIVIMDDYGKLPAGYPEAFCAMHSNVKLLILTGDARQSTYHEENPEALISKIHDNIVEFEPHCRYYLNSTHRNRRDLANALGVYSEKEGTTAITMSSTLQTGIPVLCPTIIKKTSLEEVGRRAMTYAGCQGLTAPKVQILLDSNTPLCSENVLYTALSRAVDSIHFINTGPNAREYWEKLDATPYLKTFLSTVREMKLSASDATEPEKPKEDPPSIHLPIENATAALDDYKEELIDKFDREIFSKTHGHSNAIQTEDTLVQLFQHQQAKDQTLLWATIEARIKTASALDNEIELVMKADIGDLLFMNYQRAMCLPSNPLPFEPSLWEMCQQEVQEKYLSKPIHALVNAAIRQSPDFDREGIALFLKSQWVKKVEKLGSLNVKAGQMIASFMQETVMLYGTMARYMRKVRQALQPRNILINCETEPADINEWVLDEWCFNKTAHGNDFTAFDQSQDGAMLQFELIKAKHHSIPADVIEGYRHIKLNAKIFLGTLAIMRMTGEGPTFDANTECAIAYHHTKYMVGPHVAQLYAGDDMAQDSKPILRPSFKMLEHRLKLQAKEISYTQKPGDMASFCGWLITPKGIVKDPLKLYSSLMLAKSLGKTNEIRDSYALDLNHAYKLGDALGDIFSPEQMVLHQNSVREIHLLGAAHLLT